MRKPLISTSAEKDLKKANNQISRLKENIESLEKTITDFEEKYVKPRLEEELKNLLYKVVVCATDYTNRTELIFSVPTYTVFKGSIFLGEVEYNNKIGVFESQQKALDFIKELVNPKLS